jgi:hypothetical protein
MLAETGSVIGACEAVGISRKSAYQLRAREFQGHNTWNSGDMEFQGHNT